MKSLFTAEQKAEIARRYQAGETLAELATAFGCWAATIGDQLKAMGVPRRPAATAIKARRIECPYSAEALRLRYWQDGMSVQEIADNTSAILNRLIYVITVRRWLKEAGITLRTPQEGHVQFVRRNPLSVRPGLEAAWRNRRPTPTEFQPAKAARMRKVQKLGVRAWKKKGMTNVETRDCAYCRAPITRKPYKFTRPPERTFCNASCAMKGQPRGGRKADPNSFPCGHPRTAENSHKDGGGVKCAICNRANAAKRRAEKRPACDNVETGARQND